LQPDRPVGDFGGIGFHVVDEVVLQNFFNELRRRVPTGK
jgi:hypothetical protein